MIVTVDNETEMQPIDVYALFVTDDTIDMIVEESNRYAEQEIAAARVTRRSRLVSWASDISGTRIQHTIQEAAGKKKNTWKRCRGCYEKISLCEGHKVAINKAKRVSTFCNECEGQPHLCIT